MAVTNEPADSGRGDHQGAEPGQVWEFNEARSDDPDRGWPENPFGEEHVRFSAVVDEVDGDYVALTVTQRNRHVHAPDPGAEVATTTHRLASDPRYQNGGGRFRMTTETREKVLREPEFERLLEGANRLDDTDRIEARAAILLMGRLGLRGGEVTHIDESWVDTETELIQIPAHDPCEKGRNGGLCGLCRQAVQKRANASGTSKSEVAETYWQPKTEGSVRDIPYGWSARTSLAIDLLLDEHGGWPHSFSTLQRRVELAIEAAPRLDDDATTPHGLRGTAASYHAGEGMEPEALRAMMGWRDKQVVKKYLAINGEMVRRALAEVHG